MLLHYCTLRPIQRALSYMLERASNGETEFTIRKCKRIQNKWIMKSSSVFCSRTWDHTSEWKFWGAAEKHDAIKKLSFWWSICLVSGRLIYWRLPTFFQNTGELLFFCTIANIKGVNTIEAQTVYTDLLALGFKMTK